MHIYILVYIYLCVLACVCTRACLHVDVLLMQRAEAKQNPLRVLQALKANLARLLASDNDIIRDAQGQTVDFGSLSSVGPTGAGAETGGGGSGFAHQVCVHMRVLPMKFVCT